jgi:hypothetical protein
MEITFTRTSERTYTTVLVRDDGVVIHVPSFDRPAWLPHDLAHYVVEHALALTHGFWACVAAGAVFPGMKVISGHQPPRAVARSQAIIKAAGQHGTEAEVLVGILVEITRQELDTNWLVASARLAEAWRASPPARDTLSADEMQHVCTALRDIQRQWQALAIGQSITVTWSYNRSRHQSAARSRRQAGSSFSGG